MISVLQRASDARVDVEGKTVGEIDLGLVILLGVVDGDSEEEAVLLAKKCADLRIFEDDKGKMNLSVKDVGGSVLAVSQFTLAANCKKGRRPSFDDAADPKIANELYDVFCNTLKEEGVGVEVGIFAAHMRVTLTNDGPVTIILDTDKLKGPR